MALAVAPARPSAPFFPLAFSFRTGDLRRAISSVSPRAFASSVPPSRHVHPRRSTHTNKMHSSTDAKAPQTPELNKGEEKRFSPWYLPALETPSKTGYNSRFRQHVNPLSRRYQMPTELPDNWPNSDFTNVNAPLYLDIGCGKGGFLLELVGRRHGHKHGDAEDDHDNNIRGNDYMNNTRMFEDTTSSWLPCHMNYLGLEIRPGVSHYSRMRAKKWGLGGSLSFVGCNANVDLDRLLTLYQASAAAANDQIQQDEEFNNRRLAFVSIQFPDPHFKKKHAKRGVVTPALVCTLAKFMREEDVVFLQSDIKAALEAMRDRFVKDNGKLYFEEWRADGQGTTNTCHGGPQEEMYRMKNPLGVPTEREVSVMKKGLPIYRTLFKRNGVKFDA